MVAVISAIGAGGIAPVAVADTVKPALDVIPM